MKVKQGSAAMVNGNYDIILFVEHYLDIHKIELEHRWYHHTCMHSHGTFSQLSYNIHDGENSPWYQDGGTDFTINENFRARKDAHRKDTFNLGRWSWVIIKRQRQ